MRPATAGEGGKKDSKMIQNDSSTLLPVLWISADVADLDF
jgi:hypothetical protein